MTAEETKLVNDIADTYGLCGSDRELLITAAMEFCSDQALPGSKETIGKLNRNDRVNAAYIEFAQSIGAGA